MTERRDPDVESARTHRRLAVGDAAVANIGSQAGNRALAELLSHQPVAPSPASRALRIRDSLRASRAPIQREFALIAQRAFKDELKEPGRLLRTGSRGSDVAMVQQLLGVNADGIFGPVTHARVVQFQAANGLAVDGIVGPLTFSALVSATASTGKLGEQPCDRQGSHPRVDRQGSHPRVDRQGSHPRVDRQGSHPRVDRQGSHPRVDRQGSHPRVDRQGSHPRVDRQGSHPRVDRQDPESEQKLA